MKRIIILFLACILTGILVGCNSRNKDVLPIHQVFEATILEVGENYLLVIPLMLCTHECGRFLYTK